MKQTARSPASPILAERYWDRPVPREHGDADSKPIFHAVGYASTEWEGADQALIALFRELNRTCLSFESAYTITRAYSSIESHRAQRIVLAATAEAYFSRHGERQDFERQDLRQSVAEIIDAAQWAAEGAPSPIPDADDPFGFARARYRYTSADILSFAAKFRDLRDIIWRLQLED
jgi:hypothetical protein